MASKTGIVLVGMGAPADTSSSAVRKYCKALLFDPRVATGSRWSWWFKVHFSMLGALTKEQIKAYKHLGADCVRWECDTLEKLASEVQLRLAHDDELVVLHATAYGKHTIRQAMQELKHQNCRKLIVLPLFPQNSFTTSSVVKDRVEAAKESLNWSVEVRFIEDYHSNACYVKAVAGAIEHAGFNAERGDRLLMAYRSIPLSDIEAGDSYEIQAGTTSLLIAGELNLERKQWTMAFFATNYDPREHLEPYARTVVDRWGKACDGRMFVVCPGLASETSKTQYYVNQVLRRRFLKAREEVGKDAQDYDFQYVQTLGKTRAHVRVLCDILKPYLED